MYISLSQAAGILSKSEDEVMFLNQQSRLGATVDQDSLAWEFKLDDVLKLKAAIDDAAKALENAKSEKE